MNRRELLVLGRVIVGSRALFDRVVNEVVFIPRHEAGMNVRNAGVEVFRGLPHCVALDWTGTDSHRERRQEDRKDGGELHFDCLRDVMNGDE